MTSLQMSNAMYDKLKWLAQIGIPALAALYFGLSQIWGLPAGTEVVGTLTVIDVFLGTILGLSQKNYVAPVDGALLVSTDANEQGQILAKVDVTAEQLAAKDTITLKVNQVS